MASRQDYYVILGIEENATAAEVRSAYRRAARAHHPDLNPGDASAADRFKRVQEAYDILGDPSRRAAYHRPAFRSGRSRGSYAAGWGPNGYVGAHARRPSATQPPLAPDLAEALLVLRLLAREAQLERRLRRLVRYLEGL